MYCVPFARFPIWTPGSEAEPEAVTAHVAPLSAEHSYRISSTPVVTAGTATVTAPSRAFTVGFGGGAGRPMGVTLFAALVHAPVASAVTAATWHWYAVPLASPATVAWRSVDAPSLLSIHVPSPVPQRT